MSDNLLIASIEQGPFAGGLDYPFVGESDLSLVVIDAKVVFDPGSVSLPLYLSGSIDGSGTVDVLLVDESGSEIGSFSSGTAVQDFSDGPSNRRLLYLEDGELNLWLQVAVDQTANADSPSRLDPRTYYPRLPVIRSIELKSCDKQPVYPPITPDIAREIRLTDGNNSEWSIDGQQLSLGVLPGAGTGVVDNCDDASGLIYTIAGVIPVNGNLAIQPDDCYRIEPSTVPTVDANGISGLAIEPGKLKFYQDCEPCCDCSEYEAVALAVLRQNRITDYVERRLKRTTQEHNKLVNTINRRFANVPELFVKLSSTSMGPDADCSARLSVTYTNLVKAVQDNVSLLVTIEEEADDAAGGFYAGFISSLPESSPIYCGDEYVGDAPIKQFNDYSFIVYVGDVDLRQRLTVVIEIGLPRPGVHRACVNPTPPLSLDNPVCHSDEIRCKNP